MHVAILGSGLLGTTAAWYLNKAGHEVSVIDRQPGPGLETSFGNGGQIAVSHAMPWANPRTPIKLLRWLTRKDAPLRFSPCADPHQWRWVFEFLRNCTAGRTRSNIAQLVKLGIYSRACLQALRVEAGIQYDSLSRGILHFYTDAQEFEAALPSLELMRELGCYQQEVSAEAAERIEPALRSARSRVVGAIYSPHDESGDAYKFTKQLASQAAGAGVAFRFGTTILRLVCADGKITGVQVRGPDGSPSSFSADAYVVALGSYSAPLLRSVGIDLPIYPAKGYSATFPVANGAEIPQVSLTDDEFKLVFSRLGNRLRVAGLVHLGGYDITVDAARCKALTRRTMELFPAVADSLHGVKYWAGLRPSTPSNVPIIGGTRLTNLFVNSGHGTLGWTLACGSSQALSDLIDGRIPNVDFQFCGLKKMQQFRPSVHSAMRA